MLKTRARKYLNLVIKGIHIEVTQIKIIIGSHPRKWGKLMQTAAGGNGNKRASIDSTTTATGLAIDTSSTRLKMFSK